MTEKDESAEHSGCFMFPKCMQSQGMYVSSTFSVPSEMTFPILIKTHTHNNF